MITPAVGYQAFICNQHGFNVNFLSKDQSKEPEVSIIPPVICFQVACIVFFLNFILFIYLFIYCLFAFSRAAPEACGASQARGLIGAIAAGHARATAM